MSVTSRDAAGGGARRDWDVIVVGSGIAGLVGALSAAEAGLRVIVLEKAAVIGGTTAYSEAMVWMPCSDHARRAGVTDSTDAALGYLAAAGGSRFDPAVGRAFVTQAADALRFVEQHSPVRYELTTGSIDYHPELQGATRGARAHTPLPFDGRRLGKEFGRLRAPLATTMIFGGMSVMGPDLKHFYRVGRSLQSTWVAGRLFARYVVDRLRGYPRGTVIAGGNGVLAGLMLALGERGVPIETGCAATGLRMSGGRVAAVAVRGAAGEFELTATRGVLLASGGFPRNAEVMRELYPHVAQGKPHWTLAPEDNVGDGLAMAGAVGGAFNRDLQHAAAWAPASLVPMPGGSRIPVPHFSDRAKPGVIAVDRRGQRFVNEGVSYHNFVPAMVAACERDPTVEVYLVADHTAQRKYGLGAAPPFPGRLDPFIRSGYLVCAPTLEDLARQLGIDAAGLEQTVRNFNAAAERGEDPQFGKGSGAYERSNGDATHRPNPCLAPLVTAPYYAVRVIPGDLGTFAGLRTDAFARVVDAQSMAIPGLYAAGCDAASAMAGAYPGAGIAVGSAMTFAYVAGRHLAGQA